GVTSGSLEKGTGEGSRFAVAAGAGGLDGYGLDGGEDDGREGCWLLVAGWIARLSGELPGRAQGALWDIPGGGLSAVGALASRGRSPSSCVGAAATSSRGSAVGISTMGARSPRKGLET